MVERLSTGAAAGPLAFRPRPSARSLQRLFFTSQSRMQQIALPLVADGPTALVGYDLSTIRPKLGRIINLTLDEHAVLCRGQRREESADLTAKVEPHVFPFRP